MQLTAKLDEKTALINNLLKSWANNILAIGKELSEIKDQKFYKERFKTFEEYINSTFGFSDAYGYHYINIFKKYGQNVKSFDKMKDYGMQVLINSLAVPDEYFEEMAEEVEINRKVGLKAEDQVKTIKRFSKQAGDPPRNSPKDKEEFFLKLKREGNNWKIRWETYKKNDEIVRREFREGIGKWLNSANKFSDLADLRQEIGLILKEI